MPDVTYRCACGQMVLTIESVDPSVASRITCACSGCRGFAERMDHLELLDEDGATDRFQVSPASVSITSGREHLGCIQQTKGGAFRFYARCCRSPICLTLTSRRMPFVGLDVQRLDGDPDALLGLVRARVNNPNKGAAAKAKNAHAGAVFSMLGHLMPLTARWWWRNDHKQSPFFGPDGDAIVPVERLWEAKAD